MAPAPSESSPRRIIDDHASQLSSEIEALFQRTRERVRDEFAGQLNMAVRRLRLAPDAEELCATLVDSSAAFAAGVALFRIYGQVAKGDRIRGVPERVAEDFPGLSIPLFAAAALGSAVETRDPVTTVTTPAEVSTELARLAGHSPEGRAFVFPVAVHDRIPALLYAWGDVQFAGLELLSQVAGAVWSAIAEPAPPDLVKIAPAPEAAAEPQPAASWDSLSPDDQRVHLRAQRFARVHVAEMRLFASDAVKNGRAERDLYSALRRQIDTAREKFRESFFSHCPTMVDYLHLELVSTLANDEQELLGKEYPGPMV